MNENRPQFLVGLLVWARGSRIGSSKLGRLFLDEKFAHYTWIGVFISAMNVVLLYVLIDLLHIHTITSSILVVVVTFLLRYVLFDKFKVI